MNFFLSYSYLHYLVSAKTAHHLHSPFLYELYTQVILNNDNYYAYSKMSSVRQELMQNQSVLNVTDLGAGSKVFLSNKRSVSDIAKHGMTKPKYAMLLFRLVEHFQCKNILELGTSLGLTTMYLAAPNPESVVLSFEGSSDLCNVANEQIRRRGFNNVEIIPGNFDVTFQDRVSQLNQIDFLFLDGNHRKEPTLRYFECALKKKHADSVFVFDDIHWSKEMYSAWTEVKNHSEVTLSIDLFQFGIVFFRKENKIKENVVLRF